MEWSDEEQEQLWRCWTTHDHEDDVERCHLLASRAVELFTARASVPTGQVADVGSGRPTVSELEAILGSPPGTYRVDVQPNGEIRAIKRHPCSPTCAHDDAATPGHPERVKERSEAVVATLADPSSETDDSCAAIDAAAESDAYDRGAEAMRAACWEAVQEKAHVIGLSLHPYFMSELKSAIEGATP